MRIQVLHGLTMDDVTKANVFSKWNSKAVANSATLTGFVRAGAPNRANMLFNALTTVSLRWNILAQSSVVIILTTPSSNIAHLSGRRSR